MLAYVVYGFLLFIGILGVYFAIYKPLHEKRDVDDDDLGYLDKLSDDEFLCDFKCKDNNVYFDRK